MYKELIVNVTGHETRVALLEDRSIVEFFIEKGEDSNIAGNIYKGRVQRVLPGMQAAFVDIGLDQAAFLYVDDVIKKQNLDQREPPPPPRSNQEQNPCSNRDVFIENILTEGHEIMVQIAKAPMGTKGARVTSYISLPGRYLVLMPNVDHIGVSKRIEGEEERERLRNIVERVRDVNYGFILRTSAEGVDEDRIKREVAMLVNSWENIKRRYREHSSPYLLHRDLSVTFRAIRDLVTHEAEKLVIDSWFGYQSVLSFLKKILPELQVQVEYYDRPEPIFEHYHIEGAIARALKRKVWLKSGGFIVIEHTEALTSIDVNTGRYVGRRNFEETILKTNLEAVREIAYQIRLRNIGGIIVIDFIDMESPENRESVFLALKEIFENDRCKTKILPMSEIGLIQMTRKRVRKSISSALCEPCKSCGGQGVVISRSTVAQRIYREIRRHCMDMVGNAFVLKVNPDIADYLHQVDGAVVKNMENYIGKKIDIYAGNGLNREEFELTEKIV